MISPVPAMQSDSLQIRKALEEEANGLSDLAFRSKSHWGYPPEFMQAAKQELAVSSDDIRNPDCHYFIADLKTRIVGFYVLGKQTGDEIELDAMFVEPESIGRGVGKALMNHAKNHAATLGASRMIIQSDPYAEGFYKAAGAKNIGKRESESIPGRFLPLLEIENIAIWK